MVQQRMCPYSKIIFKILCIFVLEILFQKQTCEMDINNENANYIQKLWRKYSPDSFISTK